MSTFDDILKGIELAGQVATAAAPAVQGVLDPAQRIQAITSLVQIGGATAIASTSNPEIQAKASSATSLATSLIPIIFAIASLFHSHATATTPAA